MEEDLKQLVTESILEFLDSDYEKGFLTGIKIAVEIITKQIPTPSEERNHYGN
ncbi:UNVERIFIED_CONTAM: hypothetical protein KB573_03590 [Streptococcus canis]|uniref:Phage protein n=1 Tax=Streptococcus canis FSL Z3-227 TaxID=482234 RepID=A0AAV3FSV9_STRCB|nr:hypothetical protein [Streptococcus canis]EIQ81467.1 hypothetical protein SCAZ3_03545 [Streptococcus canis FSL Z3-227]MDV6023420.1 hypothetical protein [Streptococcus canis]QBX32098.1 hypothetical protein Javan94_0007 [Streptococcus phage Javan94]GFK31893.1 hypothetical protein ScFU149_20080 [Streptococcus canis]